MGDVSEQPHSVPRDIASNIFETLVRLKQIPVIVYPVECLTVYIESCACLHIICAAKRQKKKKKKKTDTFYNVLVNSYNMCSGLISVYEYCDCTHSQEWFLLGAYLLRFPCTCYQPDFSLLSQRNEFFGFVVQIL